MDQPGLYQEIIRQHASHPRHRGALDSPDVAITVENPTCGDEVTLHLRVRDGTIEAARFQGEGCAISQASASMMADRLEGITLREAAGLAQRFRALVQGDAAAGDVAELRELRALRGVARYPVRVRCALLAWEALRRAGEQVEGRAARSAREAPAGGEAEPDTPA